MRRRVPLALIAAGLGAGVLAVRRARRADLAGEVALVTGASRGLGLGLARELGRHGCRLVICARDPGALEAAYRDLDARGIETLAVPCDVADPSAVDRLVRTASERFGGIDILVNNAGIISVAPVRALGRAEFEDALAVDFWGTVHPTLAVLPGMRERGRGRIVNITSIGGVVAVPHLLPYTAAKFAARGFSEGLAAESAADGITVTTIVPGLMRTGSFLHALFGGQRRREFAWFSLGAALPLVSMDAERAARQIVAAMRRGDAERVLSLPAKVLARLHGVAPGTTVRVLTLVNRMLPQAVDAPGAAEPGFEVDRRLDSRALRLATALGRRAARRFNQRAS